MTPGRSRRSMSRCASERPLRARTALKKSLSASRRRPRQHASPARQRAPAHALDARRAAPRLNQPSTSAKTSMYGSMTVRPRERTRDSRTCTPTRPVPRCAFERPLRVSPALKNLSKRAQPRSRPCPPARAHHASRPPTAPSREPSPTAPSHQRRPPTAPPAHCRRPLCKTVPPGEIGVRPNPAQLFGMTRLAKLFGASSTV
jgi:hypothetical protein